MQCNGKSSLFSLFLCQDIISLRSSGLKAQTLYFKNDLEKTKLALFWPCFLIFLIVYGVTFISDFLPAWPHGILGRYLEKGAPCKRFIRSTEFDENLSQ